jgi:hypothetical protein
MNYEKLNNTAISDLNRACSGSALYNVMYFFTPPLSCP